MSKGKRVTRVYYPQGPDGPAEYDDLSFTTDDNALAMYESEVERHIWLYLAAQRGEPVPGHPAAHAVNVSGLTHYPHKRSTNIPAQAVGVLARLDEVEVEARVHSIRTAKGRLLRRKGTSRREADATGKAMAAMRGEHGRNTGSISPSSVPLPRGDYTPLSPVKPTLVPPQPRIHVPRT